MAWMIPPSVANILWLPASVVLQMSDWTVLQIVQQLNSFLGSPIEIYGEEYYEYYGVASELWRYSQGAGTFGFLLRFYLWARLGLIGGCLIVLGILFRGRKVKDADIDTFCADHIKNLKWMALRKLGIDESQVKEISPIQFDSYCYEEIPAAMPVRTRVGKDGRLRTSNYHAVIFLFSADQIYRFSLVFSLLEDEQVEETDECFYSDVVSIYTKSCTFARDVEKVKKSGTINMIVSFLFSPCVTLLKILRLWKHSKTKTKFEKFRLFTSGSEESHIVATISDVNMEAAARSIQGMKSLLRSKKQQSQR